MAGAWQPSNFAQMFFEAQQVAETRKRRKLAEEQFRRQKQQQAAAQKAAQDQARLVQQAMKPGTLGQESLALLMGQNPKLGMEIQGRIAEQQKQRDFTTQNLARAYQSAEGNPRSQSVIANQWSKLADQGRANPMDLQPQAPLGDRLGAMIQGAGEPGFSPEAISETGPTGQASMQDAVTRALAAAVPGAQEKLPEFVRLQQIHAGMPEGPQKRQLGQLLAAKAKSGGGVNIYTGEISKKNVEELQTESLQAEKTVPVIDDLLSQGERFLGWGAKAQRGLAWVKNNLKVATPEERQMLDQYRMYKGEARITAMRIAKAIEKGRMSDEDRSFYLREFGLEENSSPAETVAGLKLIRKMATRSLDQNREIMQRAKRRKGSNPLAAESSLDDKMRGLSDEELQAIAGGE